MNNKTEHIDALNRYYKIHSVIYDYSRWPILFGRNLLIRKLTQTNKQANRILEVGCGTGKNLKRLQKQFPKAVIIGLDSSQDMLNVAAKKFSIDLNIQLQHAVFERKVFPEEERFDIIIFSYCLSMFGDNWSQALDDANHLLNKNGHIAVVDFHDTPLTLMRNIWRSVHVKMDAVIEPYLQHQFSCNESKIQNCYFGLWCYFYYIGHKS